MHMLSHYLLLTPLDVSSSLFTFPNRSALNAELSFVLELKSSDLGISQMSFSSKTDLQLNPFGFFSYTSNLMQTCHLSNEVLFVGVY